MSTSTLIAGPLSKMGRADLAQILVPQATRIHRPVPHHETVEALVETLSFRHIGVINDEYAVWADGMKMFASSILKRRWSIADFPLVFETLTTRLCVSASAVA